MMDNEWNHSNYRYEYIFLVQVQLRTEVLRIPTLIRLRFELITPDNDSTFMLLRHLLSPHRPSMIPYKYIFPSPDQPVSILGPQDGQAEYQHIW